MRSFLLRVDLPDKRFSCPLGANEGIFSTNKIDITAPEQPVVIVLGQKIKREHAQFTALPLHARAKMCCNSRQRLAGRNMKTDFAGGFGKQIQQIPHRGGVVTKKANVQPIMQVGQHYFFGQPGQPILFSQQAAGGRRKPGEEEIFD